MNNKINMKKDALIGVLLVVVISGILISFDLAETLYQFSQEHEEYELDEILLVILCLPFALSWFSYRRLKEIQYINKNLEKEIKLEVEKITKQNEVIEKQARNVLLGEMISNIAHQWRQPLNSITTVASGVKLELENDMFEEKNLSSHLDSILNNSSYLSKTIDIFRNFVNGTKNVKTELIKETIENTFRIIGSTLKKNSIDFDINYNKYDDLKVSTMHNELQQVLLNILNNSKDAMVENETQNAHISININYKNKILEISIIDNAGGINPEILERVFEPYFTTKHQSQGTGLGLYMVKKIVEENLGGNILIENYKKGLLTKISIPDLE